MNALHIEAPDPWAGGRFAVHHAPAGRVRGAVLYLHPLAEEMNKSRRMVARQAARLCAGGWHVLVLDRRGCGDSEGESADMDWEAWRADVRLGLQWLRERAGDVPLWLWGLRSGALLAAEVLVEFEGCAGLLLWQPQASGKLAVQQFLRLRAAAEMLAGQGKGTTDALRQSLREGHSVAIAGYTVARGLIDGLESASLAAVAVDRAVVWLEIGEAGAAPAPASQRVIEAWRKTGARVLARVVPGPMFWQTTEIEDAPALWRATDEAMAQAA